MSVSPFWIKKMFGKSRFLLYKYRSEAYYWSLVLELEKLSGGRFEALGEKWVVASESVIGDR